MPIGASGRTEHLWFVLTNEDENGKFLAVNLTSFELYKDKTVVLDKGHPFITKKSVINYSDATIFDARKIDEIIQKGFAAKKQSCSVELLREIRDGLLASDESPQETQDYLTLRLS